MDKTASHDRRAKGKQVRLGNKIIPISTLLLVIAITASIYFVYGRYPERLVELKTYTYGGAFLISLIGNATIILPGAVLVILANMGIVLHPTTGPIGPIMVGLAGGVGAAIGEITGYVAGYSGRTIVLGQKRYARVEGWLRKWGAMTIFLLSIAPLLFDLVGITAGTIRFPLWKFILLCCVGRVILYVSLVLGAALGWEALLPYLG